MRNIISITSRGQLNLPKALLDDMDITPPVKAIVSQVGNKIIVEPRANFWSLEGSLKSEKKLSDVELREAREAFSKEWGSNEQG